MDHAILHGKPLGIFLYFKYNKALSDDNGMGGFTGGSHPLRLGVQGGANHLNVTGYPKHAFQEIYNYSANFYPISVKCLPNVAR
jgi:hypothetical protein